jgi:hypothetical protein
MVLGSAKVDATGQVGGKWGTTGYDRTEMNFVLAPMRILLAKLEVHIQYIIYTHMK